MVRRTNSLHGVDVATIGGGAVGISAAFEPAHDPGPLRPDRFGPRLKPSVEPEPIGAGAP